MQSDKVQISKEEVLEIVQKKFVGDRRPILNYWLEPYDETAGLCGDHAVLTVILKPNDESKNSTESTFFIKAFPSIKATAEFAEGTGAFKKEIFTYDLFDKFLQEDIQIIKSCIPECYYRRSDLLVMEDLTKKCYKTPNKHKLLDYDLVKEVLYSLARLHASSLIYEEKLSDKLQKTYRLFEEYESYLEESYFSVEENHPNHQGIEAAITGILNMTEIFNLPHKLVSGSDFKEVLERLCRQIFDLVKPSQKYRNVVCHGDLWVTNFLIKPGKGLVDNCKFVDFQGVRYAPPANDVMSLIYLTTSREFRNKYMYDLIGIYYNELEKHAKVNGLNLSRLISFPNFLASCEEQKAFALVEAAIYFPLILMNNDELEVYFSDYELNRKTLYEDRSLLVRHNLEDENYVGRIREAMEDLRDYCDYL